MEGQTLKYLIKRSRRLGNLNTSLLQGLVSGCSGWAISFAIFFTNWFIVQRKNSFQSVEKPTRPISLPIIHGSSENLLVKQWNLLGLENKLELHGSYKPSSKCMACLKIWRLLETLLEKHWRLKTASSFPDLNKSQSTLLIIIRT
jgi:hypothetical protein